MIEDIFEKSLNEEITVEGLLNNYLKYISRISTLKCAITNIEKYSCCDAGTSNYSGMTGGTGFTTCNLEATVVRNDEVVRNMQEEIRKAEEKITMIDDLIKILKPRNRNIVKGYYIEQLQLREIADKEKYDINTIKIAKKNSLDKMQKVYNTNNSI